MQSISHAYTDNFLTIFRNINVQKYLNISLLLHLYFKQVREEKKPPHFDAYLYLAHIFLPVLSSNI